MYTCILTCTCIPRRIQYFRRLLWRVSSRRWRLPILSSNALFLPETQAQSLIAPHTSQYRMLFKFFLQILVLQFQLQKWLCKIKFHDFSTYKYEIRFTKDKFREILNTHAFLSHILIVTSWCDNVPRTSVISFDYISSPSPKYSKANSDTDNSLPHIPQMAFSFRLPSYYQI